MTPRLTFEPQRGFGVYLHWPYCTRICPYCDFNVYAAKKRDPAPLVEAMLADLAGWRERSGERSVDAIFFGGGTPSLLSGRDVGRLLAAIDGLWGVRSGAEITLEANPDDHPRFADFAAAGVTRISLGVQSLDARELAFLGRTHAPDDALAAHAAAAAVVGSVSLDFIYALPGQSLARWRAELSQALRLNADHLSLYELTIEPGAAFSRAVKRGAWTPPDDDRAADLYELTQELCAAAGYPAYEISNHARAPEHQARLNTIYWRSGDWVGVGPGAHGRFTAEGARRATTAVERPEAYIKAVAEKGVGWADLETLSALAVARERLAMGLRLATGFDLGDVEELGVNINRPALADVIELGLADVRDDHLTLRLSGRLAADRIVAMISP